MLQHMYTRSIHAWRQSVLRVTQNSIRCISIS